MIPAALSDNSISKNARNNALQVVEITVVKTKSRSEGLKQPFAKK